MAVRSLWTGSKLIEGSTLSVNGQWTYWWQCTVCEWAVNLLMAVHFLWMGSELIDGSTLSVNGQWTYWSILSVNRQWTYWSILFVNGQWTYWWQYTVCEEASSWDDPVQLAGCWNPMTNQLWVCMVFLKWNMHGADPLKRDQPSPKAFPHNPFYSHVCVSNNSYFKTFIPKTYSCIFW